MTTITYLDHQGNARSLDVAEGDSVMLGAVNHDLDGIEAYCGGACACATCHVYVNEAWLDKLPPIAEKEQNMLKFVMDRRPNSRLSCQIKVSAELDGLIVTTPEYQI
ncbi:MAG: (2Fe-2S)-binding protein [Neisseriaceae bacterium]|nr:(2Fe-2S)-binding protein [Neisseriaceae bacterium]